MMRLRPILSPAALVLLFVLSPSAYAATAGEPSRQGWWANMTAWTARIDCRQAKRWIRRQVVSEQDLRQYGLYLRCNLGTADPIPPIVVFVHGFNSGPGRNEPLVRPLCAAGYPTAVFAYPNDDAIDNSSALLSHELKRLERCFPSRDVALLTHSMGGLVARACVENPRLDPGNVSQLIMIAPPSHGTLLAHVAQGTDLYEHTVLTRSGGPVARIKASIVDGLAEAVDDVRPGSSFLSRLNARGRNPRIRYTVLLGSQGFVTAAELSTARRTLQRTTGKIPWVSNCGRKLDLLLSELDEVVIGEGDGVVAIQRGRLADVGDTHVLPFDHVSVTGPAKTPTVKRVHAMILDRLRADMR